MTVTTFRIAVLFGAAALLAQPAAAQKGPAASFTGLRPDVISLGCAPVMAVAPPRDALRITGGQDTGARRIFGQGDLITINAGTRDKMEEGREYFVRRPIADRGMKPSPSKPAVIQTVGWVRVWAVDDEWSLVTVTHGCDTIEVGDFLEPFVVPAVPTPSRNRNKPERDNYAHVMLGSDRRTSFGTGDYLVVDRGGRQNITPGMQFVLYRNTNLPENFLYDLGEAVAVDVREDTATLRVTVSRDAIQRGDLVAMRREK
jgi:hypothetical protein